VRREISIDARRRVAWVGSEVTWRELLPITLRRGLTGLIGLADGSLDASVVGDALGGDLSWFSRAFGHPADSLLSVDLAGEPGAGASGSDAAGAAASCAGAGCGGPGGTVRRVTARTDPELFRALRDGHGADAGNLVAAEISLHPAPAVFGGRLLWPLQMARPVLAAFRDIAGRAPDELTLRAQLLRLPPGPPAPERLRGGAFVAVDVAFLGGAREALRLLAPLRQIPAIWLDTLHTLDPAQLPELGDRTGAAEPVPATRFGRFLHDLDDAAIHGLLDAAGAAAPLPLPVIALRQLGGALGRPKVTSAAVGVIDDPFQLLAVGHAAGPEQAADSEWAFAALTVALTGHLSARVLDRPGPAASSEDSSARLE
jgi:hypothetical protein